MFPALRTDFERCRTFPEKSGTFWEKAGTFLEKSRLFPLHPVETATALRGAGNYSLYKAEFPALRIVGPIALISDVFWYISDHLVSQWFRNDFALASRLFRFRFASGRSRLRRKCETIAN